MKKRYSIFAMTLVIAAFSLAMTACNTSTSASDNSAKATYFQSVTEIVTDAQGSTHIQEATKVVEINAEGTVEKSEESSSPTEKNDKTEDTDSAQSNNSVSSQVNNNNNSNNSNNNSVSKTENNKPATNTNSNSGSSSSSVTSKPSSNSSSSSSTAKPSGGNTSSSAGSTTSKVWHEAVYEEIHHPAVTEQIWVVDKEAYTWEKPIYEEIPSVICLTCGEDITDNIKGHDMEVHVPNDENFSYTVRSKKVLVGTETITVPEEGHYETKIIKEEWTEKKLVKEAGYY